MSFLGQLESTSQSPLWLVKIYASSIVMSQMQKPHVEARARTRKTNLDWYHSRRKFDSRFGRPYRRVTEDMFQNLYG